MENYFDTQKKSDCNGCGACSLRCPQNAITMIEDSEGFLYPKIDKNKCINCGLCKKICSNKPGNKNDSDTYIAVNKDKDILSKSSSGGMFSILAEYVLNMKGVVFGVGYNLKNEVEHDYIEKKENIKRFRFSKYVRSDLKDSYIKVEEFLKKGKTVLFTGTPCQCAGLRAFLNKEYDRLITCEIVCHSNSSPKIYKMYLRAIEKKYNKKIKQVFFRYKKYGWHGGNTYAIFDDNTEIEIPEYTNAFLNNLICRPSCHECRFSSIERFSDFTIGDFWGIDKVDPSFRDDNTGISLLNVNTNKGKKVFEKIKEKMLIKKIDSEKAFENNHHGNNPQHAKREMFFKKIESGEIDDSNIIECINKYLKKPLYRKILGRIKRIIIKQ